MCSKRCIILGQSPVSIFSNFTSVEGPCGACNIFLRPSPYVFVGVLCPGKSKSRSGIGNLEQMCLTLSHTQVPSSIDDRGRRGEGWESTQCTARLFVSLTGGEAVGDVTVSVSVPEPFTVREGTVVLSGIRGGGTPRALPITFGLSSAAMPTDLEVTIMAHYNTPRGEPRSASTVISLPLTMCGKQVPPIKTADFKYTLDTNRPAPPLWAIFEDLFPPEVRICAVAPKDVGCHVPFSFPSSASEVCVYFVAREKFRGGAEFSKSLTRTPGRNGDLGRVRVMWCRSSRTQGQRRLSWCRRIREGTVCREGAWRRPGFWGASWPKG